MREGYKRTEIGVIPEDWRVKRLGEVTKLIKDGTHNPPPRVDKGIPLLSAENIFNRKVNYGINEKNISIDDYNNMHKNYTIGKGDILMTIVGTIGRVAVVHDDNKFTVQRSVAIIRSNEELNNEYLSYFLESDICKKDLNRRSNSTAQAGLYLGELGKIKIILPPLEEQEKISEILSTVDLQIDDTEKLIEKSKELKKGLMQKLLTKGIGHSEFKKTEVGEIPVSWEVCEIGEKANVKSSKRVYKSDYIEQGIPFYRSKEIIELSKNMEPTVELYIDELKYNEFKSKFGAPQKGDLLITSVGSVGNTWVSDGRAFYYKDGNLTQIDSNENINTKFLSYLFESDYLRRQYLGQSNGSAQVALTIEKLKKLVIALPSIDEQNTIVTILLSVDNEIEEHQNKKQKLEELKKGLMQQLLTGKIRVVK